MAKKETKIESDFVEWAGWQFPEWKIIKMKPHHVGWPDRGCFGPRACVFFIEFKRPGETPDKIQLFVHDFLRALGFDVYVCDSTTEAQEILQRYIHT